jgi:DNA polymerase-3 subunit gamma/tau
MTGATSPRLHLELMVARILVPASDASARGTLARVERLERRVGVEQPPLPAALEGGREAGVGKPLPEALEGGREAGVGKPLPEALEGGREAGVEKPLPEEREARLEGGTKVTASTPVTFQQLVDSWPEILEVVGKKKRAAWAVAFTAKPMGLKDDVLALAFPSQNDVENFKKLQAADQSVSEILRHAIIEVLGIRVKFIAKPDAAAAAASSTAPPVEQRREPVAPETSGPAVDAGGWAVAAIPQGGTVPGEATEKQDPKTAKTAEPKPKTEPKAESTPKDAEQPIAKPANTGASAKKTTSTKPNGEPGAQQRYGEAVVREILGANFIEEKTVTPRVTPTQEG